MRIERGPGVGTGLSAIDPRLPLRAHGPHDVRSAPDPVTQDARDGVGRVGILKGVSTDAVHTAD